MRKVNLLFKNNLSLLFKKLFYLLKVLLSILGKEMLILALQTRIIIFKLLDNAFKPNFFIFKFLQWPSKAFDVTIEVHSKNFGVFRKIIKADDAKTYYVVSGVKIALSG